MDMYVDNNNFYEENFGKNSEIVRFFVVLFWCIIF